MAAKPIVFLALATMSLAQRCPLQFDGRIAANVTPASFDLPTSIFNPSYVFGQNLTWSKIIQLPSVAASLFDEKSQTKAVEVTLSDESIFAASETNIQTGFRRAELQPASNDGKDPSTIGLKTLHFSLRKDDARPLNFSHEYQLAFLETADYSTNQFALKTGTILGAAAGGDPDTLVLQTNVRAPTDVFRVPFASGVWHNFGLVLDFDKNTTQVLYSTDSTALKNVSEAVSNDLSGRGQFHFGLVKKPTGENLTDVTKQGFQETGINEGIIFGGIFQENSADGCISLAP